MLFIVPCALLLSLVLYRTEAAAFGGCEEDCAKCHSLDKNEAQQILERLHAAGAKVLGIKMSPIRGLWEVDVDNKGNRGVLYVGFSKKYVIGGSIYEVETAANKTQESLQGIPQPDRFVDVSKIQLQNAILLGDKHAAHKVIVFTDPDCPFCAKLHEELRKVISERKDIAFYLELMPLKFHPDAYWKSQSILCAKSLSLLEENFEKKPIPKPGAGCDSKAVDQNLKTGQELGITGTPTLIMPDGLVVVGGRDAATLIRLALDTRDKGAAK